MRVFKSGFTLIELTLVISIIAILSTVLLANFGEGAAQSRDTERKAELRNLQTAIELYRQRNGEYPLGCNGVDDWSGQARSGHECGGGNFEYIVDLAPEFISSLPVDPRATSNTGYVYYVNADQTVFKLVAHESVESEIVTNNNTFRSCDVSLCAGSPSHCQETNSTFQTSYGVWGGYAAGTDLTEVDDNTRAVICTPTP